MHDPTPDLLPLTRREQRKLDLYLMKFRRLKEYLGAIRREPEVVLDDRTRAVASADPMSGQAMSIVALLLGEASLDRYADLARRQVAHDREFWDTVTPEEIRSILPNYSPLDRLGRE